MLWNAPPSLPVSGWLSSVLSVPVPSDPHSVLDGRGREMGHCLFLLGVTLCLLIQLHGSGVEGLLG